MTDIVALAKGVCFALQSAPSQEPRGAPTVNYVGVPFDVLLKYHHRAARNVLLVDRERAMSWLKSRHEQETKIWVERHRQTQLTLGSIILQTYTEREAVWTVDSEDKHVGSSGSKRPRAEEIESSSEDRSAKRGNRQAAPPKTVTKTVTKMRDGTLLCVAWNSGRCGEPCQKGHLHACNRELKNGRACAMKNHRSINCAARRRA